MIEPRATLTNWFNEDVRTAIRERRRAERKWRRTNLPEQLAAFKRAKNYASNQLNTARTNYLSDFISENSDNQRKLFRATNALLAKPRTLSVYLTTATPGL